MPAICERRILAVGGSKAVAIPSDWLAAFELRLGDIVEVIHDSIVLVKPQEMLIDLDFLCKELAFLRKKLPIPRIMRTRDRRTLR
jgi:antitoxin component of MazEF toxin-antitoxin module